MSGRFHPASAGRHGPRVSVVVPARNGASTLPRFAECMRSQTLAPHAFEVTIVDDASSDGTPEIAERLGLRVLSLPVHGGPYVARNAGVRASHGDLLAFTDADCEPGEDWLDRGVHAFEDGIIDLIGGAIEVPLGDRPSLATLLDFANFVNQERAVERGYALGGNVWFRRALFDRLGGFNERLLSGGDQELTRRAVAAGATLLYASDVRVSHSPSTRGRELARKARRIGFGAAQHRRFAEGSLRSRHLMCDRPGYYLPWRKLHGLDRLQRIGYRVTRRRRMAMLAASYFFFQLPMVLGNLEGVLRVRGRPVRPEPAPRMAESG